MQAANVVDSMHEYSLARTLLKQVEALRVEHRADRVVAVELRVGEFSGIDPELLGTAWSQLAGELSLGEAPRLEIRRVPLTVRCDDCGRETLVHRFRFECGGCGSRAVTVVSGEEMILENVRLERVAP